MLSQVFLIFIDNNKHFQNLYTMKCEISVDIRYIDLLMYYGYA